MKPGVRVTRAKRKKNWGNPIIDKLMQLKYRINDTFDSGPIYSNTIYDNKFQAMTAIDDKNYVMSLIKDVRKNGLIKLSHEDGLKCNSLWRKYAE